MSRILIIEDEASIRRVLTKILSEENETYQVDEAEDGSVGYEKISQNDYDLVLCDIKMPKVDGIAVLQNFKDTNFLQKVIVLSSYDEIKLIKEVLKIGALGFLAKKCAAENIIEAINTVNKGKQYFEKSIQDKLLKTFNSNITDKETFSSDGSFMSVLTPREIEVLHLIAKQYNTKEISEELHITVNTVETHRKSLISKLNVKNVVGLAIYAIKNNLV